MPERWLDGSIRPSDVEGEAFRALVARLVGTGFGIERAPGGMTTPVYRLRGEGECLYLRMSEDPGGSMHAEAAVHEYLRAAGVSVPEVVVVDDGPEISRGVLLMREIGGAPVAGADGIDLAPILRAAGRDLAVINALAVEGFGWIRREQPVWPPQGEDATYEAFVNGGTGALAVLADRLPAGARGALEARFGEARADDPPSMFAHGDFDVTHVFHRDGRYTGVIDLGEMRGAEPYYDLAYFLVHDQAGAMLQDLLAGYREMVVLPGDLASRLRRSATMIVATQLSRWIVRDGLESLERPSGRWWLARLGALLGDGT